MQTEKGFLKTWKTLLVIAVLGTMKVFPSTYAVRSAFTIINTPMLLHFIVCIVLYLRIKTSIAIQRGFSTIRMPTTTEWVFTPRKYTVHYNCFSKITNVEQYHVILVFFQINLDLYRSHYLTWLYHQGTGKTKA